MCNAGQYPKVRERSEVELVAAAQAGDRGAFDVLADRYRPGLLAAAFDLAGRFEVAEDLAQDALWRGWEKIGELREAGAFGPWLRMIVVNCYRMWLRRPWQSEVSIDQAEYLGADQDQFAQVRRKELQRELRVGLRALPRQNRLALLMRYFGGSSYEEIASFLEVPVTTVAGRIYRAKLQLRRRLVRLLDEDYVR